VLSAALFPSQPQIVRGEDGLPFRRGILFQSGVFGERHLTHTNEKSIDTFSMNWNTRETEMMISERDQIKKDFLSLLFPAAAFDIMKQTAALCMNKSIIIKYSAHSDEHRHSAHRAV